eukprot:1630563-Alexandrium_andersonii.AAC.1
MLAAGQSRLRARRSRARPRALPTGQTGFFVDPDRFHLRSIAPKARGTKEMQRESTDTHPIDHVKHEHVWLGGHGTAQLASSN